MTYKEHINLISFDGLKNVPYSIKTYQKTINDILFGINLQYILPTTTTRVLNDLKKIGVEINTREKNSKYKTEIIQQLRQVCKSLIDLNKKEIDKETLHTRALKICKYTLINYIHNREKYSMDDKLKQLRHNLVVYGDIKDYITDDEVKKFKELQEEILEEFKF